ncbi:MAG: rRNA cytosine-C5-methylase [Rikenellaceae bacterium]|nr:rRNA cytosine-C5-methylase [Rikenellaceae bacterium]
MFPADFVRSMEQSLGVEECAQLLEALDTPATVSIRFNPYKVAQKPEGCAVPWNRYGFYLDERPVFTLDPLMHGGIYYVQEASSMFVEELYRQVFGDRDDVRVLDMCAAPGGKTTLYSTLVGVGGMVLANEPIRNRAMILADNVKRWGIGNVAVTCNDPAQIGAYEHMFDLLAIDAPCSGEGMFRKNEEARREWSASNVEMCAARQRRIIADGWAALKPGGVLIYSTCTFNPIEDEGVVEWMMQNFDCEPVDIDIPNDWGIVRTEVEGVQCFHFYPHKAKGEGFFAAVLRKSDGKLRTKSPKARKTPFGELDKRSISLLQNWVEQPEYVRFMQVGEDTMYGYYRSQYPAIRTLAEGLNMIYSGVCMGQIYGKNLKPDHALALFHELNRANCQIAELDVEQTLNYLRKQEFDLAPLAEGLNLMCCQGVPVGWSKRIGNRSNTLLPNAFRIVNL